MYSTGAAVTLLCLASVSLMAGRVQGLAPAAVPALARLSVPRWAESSTASSSTKTSQGQRSPLTGCFVTSWWP